jgi:hypothetical protein
MLVAGFALAYGVASKIWTTQNSLWWQLQRITGALLFAVVGVRLAVLI